MGEVVVDSDRELEELWRTNGGVLDEVHSGDRDRRNRCWQVLSAALNLNGDGIADAVE